MRKKVETASATLPMGLTAERDQLSLTISAASQAVGDPCPESLVAWLSGFAKRDLSEPGVLDTARHEIMAFSGRALPRGFLIIGPSGRDGMAYPEKGDVPEIQTELRKCLRMFGDESGSGHYWSPPAASIRYCARWGGSTDCKRSAPRQLRSAASFSRSLRCSQTTPATYGSAATALLCSTPAGPCRSTAPVAA